MNPQVHSWNLVPKAMSISWNFRPVDTNVSSFISRVKAQEPTRVHQWFAFGKEIICFADNSCNDRILPWAIIYTLALIHKPCALQQTRERSKFKGSLRIRRLSSYRHEMLTELALLSVMEGGITITMLIRWKSQKQKNRVFSLFAISTSLSSFAIFLAARIGIFVWLLAGTFNPLCFFVCLPRKLRSWREFAAIKIVCWGFFFAFFSRYTRKPSRGR